MGGQVGECSWFGEQRRRSQVNLAMQPQTMACLVIGTGEVSVVTELEGGYVA